MTTLPPTSHTNHFFSCLQEPLPNISHHSFTPPAYKVTLWVQCRYFQLLNQRSCWTQTTMALILNLTGLWLVAFLTIQSANVGGRSFCIRCVYVLLKFMWWWLLCFSFNAEIHLKKLDVPFPPARPTIENLDNICCQAHGRLRYPDSFYPSSGHSYLRRRGKAINRLESWYALCCSDQFAKHSDFLVLCCAQQAVSVRLCCCVLETVATLTKIMTGK